MTFFITIWAVDILLAGWIGVSAVHSIKENRPKETIYVDTAELDEYLYSLYEYSSGLSSKSGVLSNLNAPIS